MLYLRSGETQTYTFRHTSASRPGAFNASMATVQRSAASYSGTAAQRSRAGARGCVHNPPVMDSIDTQDTGPAFEHKAPGRAFPLGVHTGQNGARMPFTVACAAGVRSRCCLLHQ